MDSGSHKRVTRGGARKTLIMLPALAGLAGIATTTAEAADNKAQFKYQDKPGKNGAKCAGCRFFKAPSSCSIVTGKISPNGWCIAFAKKS